MSARNLMELGGRSILSCFRDDSLLPMGFSALILGPMAELPANEFLNELFKSIELPMGRGDGLDEGGYTFCLL